MRFTRTKAIIATAGLALSLAACGDAGGDSEGADVEVADNASDSFDDGTRMKELADAGTIKIGVKYDQPGLGFKDAASDTPTGFDVEMAKQLAASLGITGDGIEWVETISDNREPFLEDGTVDLVLASYSITDDRRKVVGQAGPYLLTGQQLLVPEDSDVESTADLAGQEVCSVTGSTSLENAKAEGMKPVGFDTYSECVEKVLDGTVEAMTTDGTILAGYAAQNEGQLKVVGEPFSEERIGVGYAIDRPEMCQWIVDTITAAYDDGKYEEAFNATLGPSGVEVPELPEMDACA
ncbi:amino acid ABC transporter substrate-binding protein, PAAT family [Nocardioides exalbidus]|uniref:Amino acid ABC transporter substrate-binding protein, PAAT family n=1 Tax=Nocardioides exalbidus TaxID=402596 RepID=A0A1H4KVT3_9ACTN|nr:glutamate ABC transporter substrate-binding protein [Nocardioides exalbidus]SEB62503.1 amino acid ABC transporter substrate-binding protein, PAAT family [Nocardioides exalbidus]